MAQEIEINVIEVNPDEVSKKLLERGAKHVGSFDYQIVNFSIVTKGDVKSSDFFTSWARVRSNGIKTTLTLKEQHGTDPEGRHEYEIEVGNFLATVKLMRKLLPETPYDFIQKHTEKYVFDKEKLEITIDKWPKIPYKMEIEGPNKESIMSFYKSLELESGHLTQNVALSTEQFYRFYNIDYGDLMQENKTKLASMLTETKK